MPTGYTKAALESIVGNEANSPTPSTKVIFEPVLQIEPTLNPKFLERDDELRPGDEPGAVFPEMFDPAWSMESRIYPDSLGFELIPMLGMPTTTAGNGIITDPDAGLIPTGATRHVWTAPFGPSGLYPKTAERILAYQDTGFWFRLKGCGTNTLSIETPASGGARLKAAGPCVHMARISDPALTPTYEALTVAPFLRANCAVKTWLGGTGETEDVTVSFARAMETGRTLAAASKYPDVLELGDGPAVVVTGTMPKRVFDADDYDAVLAGTGFAVKILWGSTVVIGATAYTYKFWLELLNCQYTDGGPEALANKRRHGGTFSWKSTSTGTAGSTKVTLINATTSYA